MVKTKSMVDVNFIVSGKITKEDVVYRNANESPFKIYGVYHDGEKYRRMPQEIADTVNKGVSELCANTTGGRVRFITDSPYVTIKAYVPGGPIYSHMTFTAQAGFDLYVGEGKDAYFIKSFVPPLRMTEGYESEINLPAGENLVTINFPLYNDVCELYIGLKEGATLLPPPDYKIEKPVVYYGSSITQGGCATRPGLSYQAHLSRWFDVNFVNLGFSGNAKGEPEMARYLASLDMSCLVIDYDYNTPSTEWLRETYPPLFKTVREKHPTLPIIMASKPKYRLNGADLDRLEVIRNVYEQAVKAGDENVYFVDGRELMELFGDDGTIDACHPGDLGFYSMAKRFAKEFEKIFN